MGESGCGQRRDLSGGDGVGGWLLGYGFERGNGGVGELKERMGRMVQAEERERRREMGDIWETEEKKRGELNGLRWRKGIYNLIKLRKKLFVKLLRLNNNYRLGQVLGSYKKLFKYLCGNLKMMLNQKFVIVSCNIIDYFFFFVVS